MTSFVPFTAVKMFPSEYIELERGFELEVELELGVVVEEEGRPRKPCLTYDSNPEEDTNPPVGRFESRRM